MRLFIDNPVVVHCVNYYWKNYYCKLFKRYAIYNKLLFNNKGELNGIPNKLFNITAYEIDAQKIVLNEYHMEKFLTILNNEELTPFDVKLLYRGVGTYHLDLKVYPKRFRIIDDKI